MASGDDPNLYFVIWFVDEKHFIYHFGISEWESFSDSKATCVEVPAGYFAVGTLPDGMPISDAWAKLFEIGFNSVGAVLDEENRKYFECFANGKCEIWAPVENINV